VATVENIAVQITANVKGFLDALESAAKAVKKFSRDVTQAAGVVAALGAAAVQMARAFDSDVNRAVHRSLDGLQVLANSLARELIPMLNRAGDAVQGLVIFWQSLSSEQRALIADTIELAAKIALIAGATSQVMELVEAFAEFGAALLPILGPLTAVAAAVVAIITLVGALKRVGTSVGDVFAEWGRRLAPVLEGAKSVIGLVAEKTGITQGLKDLKAYGAQAAANAPASAAGTLPHIVATMLSEIPTSGKEFAEVASAAADDLKTSFLTGADEIKGLFGGIGDSLGGLLDKFKASMVAGKGKHAGEGLGTAVFSAVGDTSAREFQDAIRAGFSDSIGRDLAMQRISAANQGRPDIGVPWGAGGQQFAAAGMGAVLNSGGNVSAVANGAAQGGWIGAIVALVAQSKQFGHAMDALNQMLQILADTMGELASGTRAVIGGAMNQTRQLSQFLGPLFGAIGKLLEPLGVMNQQLSMVTQLLAPVFQALAFVVDIIAQGSEMLSRGLFEVWRGVADVLGGFAVAVGNVWNAIVGALAGLLETIGAGGWADGLRKMTVDVDAVGAAFAAIRDTTYDQAKAKALETDATLAATAAISEFSESLTNVPQGFKTAAARFGAMDAQGAAAVSSVGVDASSTNVSVTVMVGGKEMADVVEDVRVSKTFQRTGRRLGKFGVGDN